MLESSDIKRAGLAAVTGGKSGRPHPVQRLSANEGFLYIPIGLIQPNPDQPRQHFDDASLDDLTASVKEKGVLQPILVRKDPAGNGFILIAGERRWRAAKAGGLKQIPALMRHADDAAEVALIENVQRQNLNPIEEAEALARLKAAKSFTDQQLARIIGKSRASVTEILTLNQLPDAIKAECRTSDTWTKSQLLTLLRAGSETRVLILWQAMHSGAARTVRDLRARTAAKTTGRPRHYRFLHRPKDRPYQVRVSFSKAKASRSEVTEALKDALKHVA